MKTIKIFFILLLVTVFYQNGFAQFGDKSLRQYIVHNIGDTLFGNISLEKEHIQVSYVEKDDKIIERKFSYHEVKTYKYESGNIIHKRFYTSYKGRPLELLIKGKINLYYEQIETMSGGVPYTFDMYYLEKGTIFKGMRPIWLTKKAIAKFITDDPISAKRLKNKRLAINMKNVQLLIEDYNKRN